MTASHHESTGSDNSLQPLQHEDDTTYMGSVSFEDVESPETSLEAQQAEVRRMITASKARAEYLIAQILSGHDKDIVVQIARDDAEEHTLLSDDLNKVIDFADNYVGYGPEAFDDFKQRINDAANLLRPNQGHTLTPQEEDQLEKLTDSQWDKLTYDEAIKRIFGGNGLAYVHGDSVFNFTTVPSLLLAEKITSAVHTSQVEHIERDVAATTAREVMDKAKGLKVDPLTPAQQDEIFRLRSYKLPHLRLTKK